MANYTDVSVGDVLISNDKRTVGRYVIVTAVVIEDTDAFAVYQAGRRKAKINLKRIFTDGAIRSFGWNLEPKA